MTLRKAVQWNGSKFIGFTDLGLDNSTESTTQATEVLVLMVVAANASWKLSIGYFFINGLSGYEKVGLVKTALCKLHSIGVRAISITCDGPDAHLSMLRQLGAKVDPGNLDASFPHPSGSDHGKVVAFLDACHMIKLVRNCMGHLQNLKNRDGEVISWRYVEELRKLQEEEGLRLGNPPEHASGVTAVRYEG